jgi:sulfonate transport system permease protein
MSRRDLAMGLGSVAVAAFFVLIWHLIAVNRLVAPVFLPAPGAAFDALVRGFETGRLSSATYATIERIFLGWLLASVWA